MWPMIKLIDRYIFLELLIPFLLTLSALMMILLTEQMIRLVELFIVRGVSVWAVGKVFLYVLPPFLVIAIPMSVLVATIISFSRLTTDSEITALRAGGISLMRMSLPVFFFGTLAFLSTFTLSVWAQPWVGLSLKHAAKDLLKQEFSLGLEAGVFNEPFDGMMIYVDSIPAPGALNGIIIYDFREAAVPVLILARSGLVINDPASDLVGFRLQDGSQHREGDEAGRYQWITFSRYEFKIDLSTALKTDAGAADSNRGIDQLKQRFSASEDLSRSDLRTLAEHYKIYAFPFSCLFFANLGIPLGLSIRRGGRMGGFAAGIGIALAYYLVMIIADFLVTSYRFSPLAASWIPNATMILISTALAGVGGLKWMGGGR